MTGIVEQPAPYLAFAVMHLVAGEVVAAAIYRWRFGRSPLVLYGEAGRRGDNLHSRRTRLLVVPTVGWAAALLAFVFWPDFRATVVGRPLVELSPAWGWAVGGLGLITMMAAQINMGVAFRVGQDERRAPERLVTTGLFAHSRNPVYLASWLYLAGVSLWAPCLAVGVCLVGIGLGMHGLVLAEERHLRHTLGPPWLDYCRRVRRYL